MLKHDFPGNVRGRPQLGVTSPTDLTFYPVAGKSNVENTRYLEERRPFKTDDPLGLKAKDPRLPNIRAFRNLPAFNEGINKPFYSPSQHDLLENQFGTGGAALLSVMGKTGPGSPQTMAVANALPMTNPRIAVNAPGQGRVFDTKGGAKPKGGAKNPHLFIQGQMEGELFNSLMSGETNLRDLGYYHGRSAEGDMMLTDPHGQEMPYINYQLSSPSKREWRQDVDRPWRQAYQTPVTGSVDPRLMIPSQEYESGYIEHEGQEGVPVPPAFSMQPGTPGITQGLATGRYGLYFDPVNLTPPGLDVYREALGGNIVRRSDLSSGFQDAWDVVKLDPILRERALPAVQEEGEWELQEPLGPLASIMGVKNLTSKKKPYRRQLTEATTPFFEEDYALVEPFMGGGGITYGLRPPRSIGSDIDPSMMSLHRAARDRPGILGPSAIADMAFTRVGETPSMHSWKGGKEVGPINVGGPVTQEEVDRYGMPDDPHYGKGGVYYGLTYYTNQARFNRLRERQMSGTPLSHDEESEYARLAYFLTKNAYGQSFRYNPQGYMTMPGPRPRASKPHGFQADVKGIWDQGKVNTERFGLTEPWRETNKKGDEWDAWRFPGQQSPEWASILSQPAYFAGGHMPQGVMPGDTQFMDYHEALGGPQQSKLLNDPFTQFLSHTMPEKSVTVFDPPYRESTGQHSAWTDADSDLVGRAFAGMARAGKPVMWYDDPVPKNLKWVEHGGGQANVQDRLEHNLKARENIVNEMFAWANIPHLDPDEVAGWKDSKGM